MCGCLQKTCLQAYYQKSSYQLALDDFNTALRVSDGSWCSYTHSTEHAMTMLSAANIMVAILCQNFYLVLYH